MPPRDPFVHLERLYAEALLRHHGLFTEPPTPPRAPIDRRRLFFNLLPYLLIVAIIATVLARQYWLTDYLVVTLIFLSPLLLAVRSIPPLRRLSGLPAPALKESLVDLALSGALLAGLTIAPALLPPLWIAYTLRTLYSLRRRIGAWTDRATIRLERARLASGATPRIYGLVDERHGGDATRLAHHGAEVARLRSASR